MAEARRKVRILVIRPWTESLGPLRDALTQAGMPSRIVRVDIEPALNAALDRQFFDVVVFDPRTPGITREAVDDCLRANRQRPAVVVFESIATTVEQIRHAIDQLLN